MVAADLASRTREQLLAHLDALTPTSRTDGLPVWWPLVPGGADIDRLRWRPPVASPPTTPDAILARLHSLDAAFDNAPIDELIAAAYPALVVDDDV